MGTLFPSGCVKFEDPCRHPMTNDKRHLEEFGGWRNEPSPRSQFGDHESMSGMKPQAAEEPKKGSTEMEGPRREGWGHPLMRSHRPGTPASRCSELPTGTNLTPRGMLATASLGS